MLFQVKSQMQSAFQKDWDNVVTVEPLLYGDFLDLKNPCYQELSDEDMLPPGDRYGSTPKPQRPQWLRWKVLLG